MSSETTVSPQGRFPAIKTTTGDLFNLACPVCDAPDGLNDMWDVDYTNEVIETDCGECGADVVISVRLDVTLRARPL